MRKLIFRLIRYTGLPFFFREIIQKKKVTILCYHKLTEEIASKTFNYLTKRYNIISLDNFLDAVKLKKPEIIPKKALIITVDDGFKENYSLLNWLKSTNIPITIFICAKLINTNRKPWYEFEHPDFDLLELQNIPNSKRLAKLEKMGFKQTDENENRVMLTSDELIELSNYANIQSHTLFHPCLPTCTDSEAFTEISQSKKHLEDIYDFNVNAFAYPNGDYSERDISILEKTGYSCAVTLDYGFNTIKTERYKLKRLGVNDTSDINELSIKASGVWWFLKTRNGKKQHYGLKPNIN